MQQKEKKIKPMLIWSRETVCKCSRVDSFALKKKNWLHRSGCRILFPDQGSNSLPLKPNHQVLTARKSQKWTFIRLLMKTYWIKHIEPKGSSTVSESSNCGIFIAIDSYIIVVLKMRTMYPWKQTFLGSP